jgi:hypothetical protein
MVRLENRVPEPFIQCTDVSDFQILDSLDESKLIDCVDERNPKFAPLSDTWMCPVVAMFFRFKSLARDSSNVKIFEALTNNIDAVKDKFFEDPCPGTPLHTIDELEIQ